MNQRVLVIDDEPQIRRALRVALRASGYDVGEAACGEEALRSAALQPPDIAILDLMLPDMDGAEVCRQLREWTALPIIILSVQDEVDIKVRALDQGADDYLTKPFSMPELLARMRVALRRHATADGPESHIVLAGDLEIDLARRRVAKGGHSAHLRPCQQPHSGRIRRPGPAA